MNLPERYSVFDFTSGYNPREMTDFVNSGGWGVGGYNEKRENMYLAPQYESRRNIHMGIDVWAKAGEPVFAALGGEVVYTANHNQDGNYGATIVLKHLLNENEIFALYGHLAIKSLQQSTPGRRVKAGDVIGWLGSEDENGNWPPHLHYQLGWNDPGEADMPGVVSDNERNEALKNYPDPRMILGNIY